MVFSQKNKIIATLLGSVFVLFAYFQFNDPDPQYWVPIYGLVALACFAVSFNFAPPPVIYWILAVVYFIAAAQQWPPHYEGFLFGELQMRSLNIELAREAGGLAIAAVVLLLMGWLSKR
jgi:Transmembrane family 220, helix